MEQTFNKRYPCDCGLSCMKAHFWPWRWNEHVPLKHS